MRRVPFELVKERAFRVWRAREAAWLEPRDARPMASEIAALLLHALQTHGPDADPLQCADEWLAHLDCYWHEYGVALENLQLGIGPPTSGSFNNDYYGTCTGGVPRADIWGLLHPADPSRAAARAAADAQLEHHGSGLEVAAFLASAVAEAFAPASLDECLRVGLRTLESSSRTAACIRGVLSVISSEGKDWRSLWSAIIADWYHPEPTDATLNLAAFVVAMKLGGLNWDDTLEIACLTGGDPTWKALACASMLAVLGADIGKPLMSKRPTGASVGCSALRDLEPIRNEEAFASSICRLVVACARQGQVEIIGAPYQPLPGPHVVPPVRLCARYEGDPVLGTGEQRAVFLERLTGADDIPGELVLSATDGLKAEPLGGVLVPGKLAAKVVNVTLERPNGPPGTVHAEIRSAARTLAEATFGFRRVQRYLAIGPFENPGGKGLDRPYQAELELSQPDAALPRGRELRSNSDLVDVDNAFGAKGPRVIYLLRIVNSPQERSVWLRIGCSDGIKLWLNGKRLLSDHTHRSATPADYVVRAHLRKGLNKILVKLARCGDSSTFRLRITEPLSEKAIIDIWD